MQSFEWSMEDSLLAGIFAGVLYAVAYFRFVNVLRYRRNWLPTPNVEIAKCVALVALVVAFVSISDSGFDLPAASVLAGFIGVLFFIVAAPTIAFRPSSALNEWLAKYADCAGLWMAPIAALAWYEAPNAKLGGVLVAAMTIEFAWFARHLYRDQRRSERPLSPYALDVLDSQAEGDVTAFARKNRIRELVIGDMSASWLGCTKQSPPCPFNLYVNRLGLNTAPCCHEHMVELCRYVDDCLTELDVTHWIEGGTLLGAVREGGLLAWEDDVDISVLLDEKTTWRGLIDALEPVIERDGYVLETFDESELIAVSFDRREPWPFGYERNRLRGEICVDIPTYRIGSSHGEKVIERSTVKADMPRTESGKYGVPYNVVAPTEQIAFLGGFVSCPKDPDGYLRLLYGDYTKTEYTYVDAEVARKRGAERDREAGE